PPSPLADHFDFLARVLASPSLPSIHNTQNVQAFFLGEESNLNSPSQRGGQLGDRLDCEVFFVTGQDPAHPCLGNTQSSGQVGLGPAVFAQRITHAVHNAVFQHPSQVCPLAIIDLRSLALLV